MWLVRSLLCFSCVVSVWGITSLSTNQELRPGEQLTSVNGQYKAVFEEDGRFVIYEWAGWFRWSLIWETNTRGSESNRIIVQSDANLVMYNSQWPVWHTNTGTPDGSFNHMRLTLINRGCLVLENDGLIIWTSEDSQGLRFSGNLLKSN